MAVLKYSRWRNPRAETLIRLDACVQAFRGGVGDPVGEVGEQAGRMCPRLSIIVVTRSMSSSRAAVPPPIGDGAPAAAGHAGSGCGTVCNSATRSTRLTRLQQLLVQPDRLAPVQPLPPTDGRGWHSRGD